MMTKVLVWAQFAMEDGRAPSPPEFHVNAGDKMELYIVREESEEKPMLYLVHKHTKEHRRYDDALDWPDNDCMVVGGDPDGWIEWQGGECPLPDGCQCEARLGDGRIDKASADCMDWRWAPGRHYRDIIAYRPILDAKPAPSIDVTRLVTSAEPPAWDGEGDKPPVGSRCMKDHAEVLVIAHANVGSLYDPAVVYQPINHPMGIDWKVSNVFSPIRSEEDRAVEEMADVMREADGAVLTGRTQESIARALHRAGYRKTGGEG